ncbi:hypothetical protein SARC_08231 [Sphaeroforma arctica JP610]|uniref:FAD-binding FR-type domain-containing protein n=1 Tax=Sphaeroforma arctica JP610 TaxID=667725 RepID=A0A0L0FRB7_9EUKA|nr:hypothetical protein SARC_08231 [Sphaeroforma arctica JP610]KNC79367.1 hypothetical protein SARC_08231 [Sphaeroforma arctica JP610]|eukprot:XP_014153269.1 hypothetical protein SARC_08231 [Sphaeroforma arctica JP610]
MYDISRPVDVISRPTCPTIFRHDIYSLDHNTKYLYSIEFISFVMEIHRKTAVAAREVLKNKKVQLTANKGMVPPTRVETTPIDVVRWGEYKVTGVIKRGVNSVEINIRLPNPHIQIGIKPGCHVFLGRQIDGRIVSQPYTPVTDAHGTLVFLIKRYEGGLVSPWLYDLLPGNTVHMRGPAGAFDVDSFMYGTSKLVCIAGGTGITAILPIVKHILQATGRATPAQGGISIAVSASDAEGPTIMVSEPLSIVLIHCDKTREEALMVPAVEMLKDFSGSRLSVVNIYSEEMSRDENVVTSRLTSQRLAEILQWGHGFPEVHAPGLVAKTKFLICGPHSLNEMLREALIVQRFGEDDFFVFE